MIGILSKFMWSAIIEDSGLVACLRDVLMLSSSRKEGSVPENEVMNPSIGARVIVYPQLLEGSSYEARRLPKMRIVESPPGFAIFRVQFR